MKNDFKNGKKYFYNLKAQLRSV